MKTKKMTPLPMAKCPATFCHLFAAHGSPWTGDKNSDCEREKCGWWQKGLSSGVAECHGTNTSFESIWEEAELLSKDIVIDKPSCKFEAVCQWQRQLGERTCPPRLAVMLGLDPRLAAG